MKKTLLLMAVLMVVSASVSGASSSVQMTVGSNIIKVDGKPITLSQNVAKTDAGIMIPIEVLSAGLGVMVKQKDNVIDVKPKESPEIVFINDDDKGLSKLLSLFDEVKYNVYISMYSLTNNKLIDKIIETGNSRGQVFLLLDKIENQDAKDVKKLVNKKNVYIKYVGKLTKKGTADTYYKYHKKIAIFDGKTIFTGSSNWTEYGFFKNGEQNFIIRSRETADSAKKLFIDEWLAIK